MTRKRETGNLYFQVIEFGLDKLEDGVTFQEFGQFITQLEIQMSDYSARTVFMEFYKVKERENCGNPDTAIDAGDFFVLKADAAFRHLEHVELQEARSSSRNAMKMAIRSLLLAAIVGGIQISLAIDCSSATQNWLSRMVCCN